jgi:anti-sigma B factor antagonist
VFPGCADFLASSFPGRPGAPEQADYLHGVALADTYLAVNVDRVGGVCVLAVSGELDVTTSAEFTARVAAAMDDQIERVVLDLGQVTFVDCSGARAITAVARGVPGGRPVIVRSLRPSARRVFDLLGLNPGDQNEADVRNCEQCGSVFVPRREHGRFCCARCRIAWNRENARSISVELSALEWSIAAMHDATGRLLGVRAEDQPPEPAAISDAVWWVTIVDATLVRYHASTYDGVLEVQPPADRQLIEETLGGLRFVRNQMGHHLDPVDFVCQETSRTASGDRRGATWMWKPLPEPALATLLPRAQEWEMTRYRAYQAQLAGHTVGEIFGRAVAFLNLVAGKPYGPDAARHQAAAG